MEFIVNHTVRDHQQYLIFDDNDHDKFAEFPIRFTTALLPKLVSQRFHKIFIPINMTYLKHYESLRETLEQVLEKTGTISLYYD